MGAGEHDLIGAPAVVFDKARRDLARDLSIVDGSPRMTRSARTARSGEPTSVTSQSPA